MALWLYPPKCIVEFLNKENKWVTGVVKCICSISTNYDCIDFIKILENIKDAEDDKEYILSDVK
eukprot:573744-Ditylum_brightwellii.AAC.1